MWATVESLWLGAHAAGNNSDPAKKLLSLLPLDFSRSGVHTVRHLYSVVMWLSSLGWNTGDSASKCPQLQEKELGWPVGPPMLRSRWNSLTFAVNK